MGPLPTTDNGNKCILVIEAYSIPKEKAETVNQKLVDEFIFDGIVERFDKTLVKSWVNMLEPKGHQKDWTTKSTVAGAYANFSVFGRLERRHTIRNPKSDV